MKNIYIIGQIVFMMTMAIALISGYPKDGSIAGILGLQCAILAKLEK